MLGHRKPKTRRFLALGIALLLISLSGCVGFCPDNGPNSCYCRRRIAPVWYGYVGTRWQPWPNTGDRTGDFSAAPAGQPQEPIPPGTPSVKEAPSPAITPALPGGVSGTPKEAPSAEITPVPRLVTPGTPKEVPSPETIPAQPGGTSGKPKEIPSPETTPAKRGDTSGTPKEAPSPEIAPVPRDGASGVPASTTPATENGPTSGSISPAEPASKPAGPWVPHWS